MLGEDPCKLLQVPSMSEAPTGAEHTCRFSQFGSPEMILPWCVQRYSLTLRSEQFLRVFCSSHIEWVQLRHHCKGLQVQKRLSTFFNDINVNPVFDRGFWNLSNTSIRTSSVTGPAFHVDADWRDSSYLLNEGIPSAGLFFPPGWQRWDFFSLEITGASLQVCSPSERLRVPLAGWRSTHFSPLHETMECQ